MSDEDDNDNTKEDSQINEVPGSGNGMFMGYYQFDPDSRFTMDDVKVILKAMDIRFSHEHFEKLPETTKRQFSVFNRNGDTFRYGRKPRHLK